MTAAYLKWLKAANAAFVAAGHPSLFGLSKRELPDDAEDEVEIMAVEADLILKREGLGAGPVEMA